MRSVVSIALSFGLCWCYPQSDIAQCGRSRGLAFDKSRNAIYIANTKGVGSRSVDWKGQRKIDDTSVFGYHSKDYLGTISLVPTPRAEELPAHTERVLTNNRMTETVNALAPPRKGGRFACNSRTTRRAIADQARAVHHQGEPHLRPGVWRRERGEGDPELCIFGEK